MIEVVVGSPDGSSPLWIDVCEPTAAELDRIAAEHKIPRAALQECTAALHLPKHERLGTTTFVITRVYDEESRPDAEGFLEMTRKLALFLGDHFLVTAHKRPLPFLDEVKERTRTQGDVFLQAVMLDILLAGVETFHSPLERAEDRIHGFESELLEVGGAPLVAWKDVFRTKVRIQTIKRLLWHVQNATQKYVPYSAFNQPLAQDLRERLASLTFLADGLDADLDNLLGVQLSLSANRTNEVVRVLTLFSAVFLPLTFVVGVYGMNFAAMPELSWSYGYLMAWMIILVTVIGVISWFQRRGWIGEPGASDRSARRGPAALRNRAARALRDAVAAIRRSAARHGRDDAVRRA